MRRILSNIIAILVAAISFVLSWWWYRQNHEIEPIIGMVAAGGALLTGLVFRFFPEKREQAAGNIPAQSGQTTVENSKNVVANSSISAEGDVHIGDQTTVNNEGANIENQFNGGTFNNPNFH
ncbi:MAG: hypothetical protein ACKVT2_20605 [Saprospiraceae bacterium]